MTRTAKTYKGHVVELNKTTKVDGGWVGYVLNSQGYAVPVFIPAN